jgi:hypothetical protein
MSRGKGIIMCDAEPRELTRAKYVSTPVVRPFPLPAPTPSPTVAERSGNSRGLVLQHLTLLLKPDVLQHVSAEHYSHRPRTEGWS